MKKSRLSPSVKFRDRMFKLLPLIRLIPIFLLSLFFIILRNLGVFNFKAGDGSLDLIIDIAAQFFPYLILPIFVYGLIIFYFNHKRLRQNSGPIKHLYQNTNIAKEQMMEKARLLRSRRLIIFEIKRAALNTLFLLMPASAVTLFAVFVMNENIQYSGSVKVATYSLFAIIGFCFWAITRLMGVLEKTDAWDIMQESFTNRFKAPGYIYHGALRGNEAFIKWLDSFWIEPVKLDYARKGLGIAFEVKGMQMYLFIDTSSSLVFYIFLSAVINDIDYKKNNSLKKIMDDIEGDGFSINIFPGGIFIRGEKNRIEDIIDEYNKYGLEEASMLNDILHKILKAAELMSCTPGLYYSSYIK